MRGTAKVFGVVIGVAALAVAAMIVIPKTMSQAGTADPTADGGGWANAGAPPSSSPKAVAPRSAASAVLADYPVSGIDVSSHDHSSFAIGWPTVASGGGSFAYIKATEGLTYTNPYFAGDFQAARDAGLMAGAYAFARPDQGNPAGQADYLVNNGLWQADTKTIVPMIDLEWPYSTLKLPACWGLSTTAMSAWIRAFVTEVEATTGRPPMIYTNANWWNPCTGNDATFSDDPLDIAAYGSTPPTVLPAGWSTFTMWQYAAGANNIANDYDRDVYNGDLNGLATLAGATVPTAVSLRAHADGEFVTAEGAGSKPLISARGTIGQWETFDLVSLSDGYVALRSHANGYYVTAAGTSLIASRLSAGDAEKFLVVHNADGSVSLKAGANGRYVTAEGAGTQALVANRTAVGLWEEFDEVTRPKVVSLRALANDLYVTADNGGGKPLIANRTAIGGWESFDLYNLGNDTVALLSHADAKWVTAEAGGTKPLIANRPTIGPWETFQLARNADGSVSLRANADNDYVTAEGAGALSLIANRTAIGAWERFDLIAD